MLLPLVAPPGWNVLLSLLATVAAILSLVLGYRTNKQTRESAERQARETRESAERQANASREHSAVEARRGRLAAQRERIYAESLEAFASALGMLTAFNVSPAVPDSIKRFRDRIVAMGEVNARLSIFGTRKSYEIWSEFQDLCAQALGLVGQEPLQQTYDRVARCRTLYSDLINTTRRDLEVEE